jgi:hypothetical protein
MLYLPKPILIMIKDCHFTCFRRKKSLIFISFLTFGLTLSTIIDVNAQTIYATDFNENSFFEKNNQWIKVSGACSSNDMVVKAAWSQSGTIDIANTTQKSGAVVLSVEKTSSQEEWTAVMSSGFLSIPAREKNLGKITLSFDHSVSSVRPIIVRVESYDYNWKRTGGLETTVYPAASDFFIRSAIDLSEMTPFGNGKFIPQDVYINFSFVIGGSKEGDAGADKHELRIDNIAYSTPAYYVSPTGKDSNDGRSEKTAFADPQKAINIAKPGDIIVLMNGNYTNNRTGNATNTAVASFIRSGAPAAWITLKNYPGHNPKILCYGRDGVRIAQGTKQTTSESPLLAYLEVRGIHFKGNSDEVLKSDIPELGTSTPVTETTGVLIDATYAPTRMYHHIRIADCTAEYCGADGIFASAVDYLAVENNILRYNCYTSAHWAMSGFSCMMYSDFDKVDNATKILVRGNQAYGNQCKVFKRTGPFKVYNGNGFLFDANCEGYLFPDFYLGRTLVQNNLVYGNGGGAIQMWGCHRIDIVNNTMYFNGITPELKWGNMGFEYCNDIRVINNIVVAQDDRPLDFWVFDNPDRDTANIVRINNLYFGGARPNIRGRGDIVADPLFVNASLDPLVADFRLKPGSPAINTGFRGINFLPSIDLSGKLRNAKSSAVDRGAYKYE